jgi:hypothetical protein
MAQGQGQSPGDFQTEPGVPSHFFPKVWEGFTTLNTKPPRPAIGDEEMWWCDGWMPLGPGNIRTLPGVGPVFYNSGGLMIVWFSFFNINDVEYVAILQNDGSMVQLNLSAGFPPAVSTIMPAGTILNPSSIMGSSQWGTEYLILAKDQDNGYWLWDAVNLYTAGKLGPQVMIDNAGSNYTSEPAIDLYTATANTPGGPNGVVFTSTVLDGSVDLVSVFNPGSGFTVNDFIAAWVSGGGSDDQARGFPAVDVASGGVTGVIIENGGQQYTGRANVVFISVDAGSGATGSCAISNGTITAISIINPGQGYVSPPIVNINDPGIPGTGGLPGGTGFVGTATLEFGQITSIHITDPGTGYSTAPVMKIIGDGTGAAGTVLINNGGQVIQVLLTALGGGYSKALVVFEGGNNAANVTPFLMPFGVSGTCVETYNQRVFVSNGAAASNSPPKNRTIYSAPQSPVDFGDGGGVFQTFDSFVKIGYHSMKNVNGFLYLIGDSSMNYLTGVTTTASQPAGSVATPITTFNINNQNVDPQVGSPWPSSVQVLSRNIVFANAVGIYSSAGGAIEKISTGFEGFYDSGPIFGSSANFSSAVATINNTAVYMLLLPVFDQFMGTVVNKLLMYDGKRLFTSQQDRNMTYIATQEINSILRAWGTDGTNFFELFQMPSTAFTKVIQSKLWATPGYYVTKTSRTLSGIAFTNVLDGFDFNISIDNESALGTGNAITAVFPNPGGEWVGDLGQIGAWYEGFTPVVLGTWGTRGLEVFGPTPIGQSGRLFGLTVATIASDVTLVSLMLSEQTFATNL